MSQVDDSNDTNIGEEVEAGWAHELLDLGEDLSLPEIERAKEYMQRDGTLAEFLELIQD